VCIKKWEFEFELSPANTMGLIPVNFGEAERAVNQTDARDSLALAPSALPVLPAQTCPLSYSAPTGNCFRGGYLSKAVVLHRACCRSSPREIVMANAVCESADVMGQLFGERERLTPQTGHALP